MRGKKLTCTRAITTRITCGYAPVDFPPRLVTLYTSPCWSYVIHAPAGSPAPNCPERFKVPASRYHAQYPEGSPSTTFPLDHRVFPFAWYLMVYPSMISVFFSAAIICTFTFVFSTVHNQHCILAFRLYWLAICRG